MATALKLGFMRTQNSIALPPMRAWQARTVGLIRQAIREGHRRIVVQSPTGAGKCLGRGTPILMFDGTVKPVERVAPGDLLMGPDSKPRNVLGIARGWDEMYRVTPVKGDSYIVNSAHILSLKRTQDGTKHAGAPVNISIKEWNSASNTFRHIHKGWRVGVNFPPQDVPLPPYLVGIWLGDGTANKAHISKPDVEIRDYVYSIAADYGLKVTIAYGSSGCPTYCVVGERGAGNPLWDKFLALNLKKNKHVPLIYKANSVHVRREILAGIIDTDGSISHGGCDYISKDRQLAEDVAFLARSLHLAAYVSLCRKTCANNGVAGDYYRVSISGDLSVIPTRIPRKQAPKREQKKSVLMVGITVEPIGIGEYFGFEIDSDGLFMLGDFTVTHNTQLAANIFSGAIAKGKRALFTVPDITLVEQTLKAFEQVGIHDVGVIQAQHERTDWNAQVQIASVQTLIRRALPEADLIVCDEVHVSYDALYKILDGPVWADRVVIGLSATPWAKGMGLHWTKFIIGATIKELIAEGILCPYTAFGPKEAAELSGVHVRQGEYDEGESAAVMSQARITADVVKTWQERWGQDRTFMFCVNRAHAREQQAKFEQAGIPFGYIDGTMTMEERIPVFEAFRSGKIKGIASVGCLSRGVDEDVRYIIDAQPTKSEMNLVQKNGRGLRNRNGKVLLIADHAGNMRDLGLLEDIHHDELDSRPPSDRSKSTSTTPKPRQCPSCNAIVSATERKCIVCGTVLKVTSRVGHVAGELADYSGGGKKQDKPAESKQAFYSEMLALAAERGHSEGWAAWRFKSRWGSWPRGLHKTPQEPSRETRKYDKYQRIKFAKSKKGT